MKQNITLKDIEPLSEKGLLGNIKIKYRDYFTKRNSNTKFKINQYFNIKLEDLFDGIKKDITNPEEIETICLFGSVLYRHFFHPINNAGQVLKKKSPSDIDFGIILKKDLGLNESTFRKIGEFYKPYKTRRGNDYGSWWESHNEISEIPVHISYFSIEQFLNNSEQEKGAMKNIIEYGLPIIGQEKFKEIVKNAKSQKRKPFHKFRWNHKKGRLNVDISPKLFYRPPEILLGKW